MSATKIAPDIYWVGGIDWNLRDFHGYSTQRGSTYNAYLIIDEKITLIDTVKHYLADEMLERIRGIIDPSRIDIIVANHVEMDHSGSLPALSKICPKAEIYCSPKGEEGLKLHYTFPWKYRVVKTGDSLKLGKRTLQFVTTPMVHWPDNMVAYCPEEKILFSNDGFGQHLASSERFDDEYPLDIIKEEARKYYANIVLPFGLMVQKELEAASKLDIQMIAPSHGIIWRRHVAEIVSDYRKWSSNQAENKALIIYDTMWQSTAKIAQAIYEAFTAKDIPAELVDLKLAHVSDVMTKLLDARFIAIGSPTLNNNVLPTVAAFLTYMKGLAPKGRIGLAFGSYGWGGQSVEQIENVLFKELSYEALPSVKVRYVPQEDSLRLIREQVAENLK